MTLSHTIATCAQDLFAHLAHQLVIFKSASSYGEHVYSLDALSKKSRRLGRVLAEEEHLQAGDRVAIVSNNPLKQIIFFWSCLLHGAQPLLLEPDLPHLGELLESFEANFIITDNISALASLLDGSSEPRIQASTPHVLLEMDAPRFTKLDALLDPDSLPPHRPSTPNEIAFHTIAWHEPLASHRAEALPSSCPVRHGELLRHLAQHQQAVHLSSPSICLGSSPLSSPTGLILGHILPLYAGCHHILCADGSSRPILWLQAIHQHRVTHTSLSFEQGRALLDTIDVADLDMLDLSSLESMLYTSQDARRLDPAHHTEIRHLLSRASLPQDILHIGLMLPRHHLLDTIHPSSNHLDGLFHLHLGALHSQGKILQARPGEPASVKIPSLGSPIWEERPWEIVIARDAADPTVSTHGELFHRFANGNIQPLGEQIGFFCPERGALHLLGHTSHEVHVDGGVIYLAHIEQIAGQKLPVRRGYARARWLDVERIELMLHVKPARSGPPDDVILEEVRAHLARVFDFAPSLMDMLQLDLAAHRPPGQQAAPADKRPLEATPPHDTRAPVEEEHLPARVVRLDRPALLALRDRIDALLQPPRAPVGFEDHYVIGLDGSSSGVFIEVKRSERETRTIRPEERPRLDETRELWLSEIENPKQHDEAPPLEPAEAPPRIGRTPGTSFFEPLPGSITERIEHNNRLRPRIARASPPQHTFLQRFLPVGHGWMRLKLELPDLEIEPEQAMLAATHQSSQHPATRVHFLPDSRTSELEDVHIHISGNRLYFKDLRGHGAEASALLRSHALSHLEGLTRQPLTGRALVYWLVLREERGHTLHLMAHRAVLDLGSARALLGMWRETVIERSSGGEEEARQLPDLDLMERQDTHYMASLARQRARHEDLNIAEFWATLFSQPYPHHSLRDPRFIQEKRALVTRHELPDTLRDASVEAIEAALLAGYARFIQILLNDQEVTRQEQAVATKHTPRGLVLGVSHDLRLPQDASLLGNHMVALPLRLDLSGSGLQPEDENDARHFIKHVQQTLLHARANAIAPEHIARVANISTLVAQGVRFVYRHEEQGINIESARLVDHPLPELNELLFVSQRQTDGSLLLHLEIGPDVQIGSRSPIQAFDLLIEQIRIGSQ